MFPVLDPIEVFGDVFDSVAGWTWNKVIQGIFTWFAEGVLLLMEWVWTVLDQATSPRLTEDWFANDLVVTLGGLALAVTTAMMLLSAIQAGWAGRPELIGDAVRNAMKAIVGSSVAVVVIDQLVQGGDVLSAAIWAVGRADVMAVLDGSAGAMTTASAGYAATFLGPLLMLLGMVGLLMTVTILFFRSVMLYLVAAFAPIILATSVSPAMRGAARRLVSVTVALVLAKPAITLTLVVGSKLVANATSTDPGIAGGAGTLFTGFACFLIAGFSPIVIFKLLPMVEGATISSGIVGGMGRTAMTGVQAGLMASSLGAGLGASAATRAVPGTGHAAVLPLGGPGSGSSVPAPLPAVGGMAPVGDPLSPPSGQAPRGATTTPGAGTPAAALAPGPAVGRDDADPTHDRGGLDREERR
jgi:hypothetical protein